MGGGTKGGSRPPLEKSLSRRVSFNEATVDHHRRPRPPSTAGDYDSSDTESQANTRPIRRGCGPLCNSCCAWTSLTVGILLILFLLLGGIYFAFLQSNLPEVRLQRLDINALAVNTTAAGDTLLTAIFVVTLNTTNGSGNIVLGYTKMTAAVSSAGVNFDEVKLADMHQAPRNTTELVVWAATNNMVVEDAAAADLQDNSRQHLLVIDVVVKGEINFLVGGKRMNSFPFKIDCHSIDQSEIDNGHAPKCNTQMSPLH